MSGSFGHRSRGGPQKIPRPDSAVAGGPPPWSHIAEAERRIDLDRLVERIRVYPAQFRDRGVAGTGKSSAVLAPIYLDDDEPMILLTRRSPNLRAHTHEVAFPGGRHDPTDVDHVETALREAEEEVALQRSSVDIVGALDWFVTGGSGSLVYPYVGLLDGPPQDLRANPGEVEAILPVSMNELLLDEVWREEVWTRGGETMRITFFEMYGDTIWGATGNMLRELLTIATEE